jgi:murein L,D-transpeptidase YafK
MTAFAWSVGIASSAPRTPSLILVDKKTNTLQVALYDEQQYKIMKTYHCTVGKVIGDKETEGDLKTPEGIYTLTTKLTPPSLKAKFGKMAFYVNYPNPFDQIAGFTGFDIMLHATNEPERLKKDFDSEGCVVVNNEDISEIESSIRLGLTPVLIFSELKPDYLKPAGDPKLKAFFERWVKSWETKDEAAYIDSYHSDFTAQGMKKPQWKTYKAGLNKRYKSIQIGPENVLYFRHPKYSMITFVQNYRSVLASGGKGHASRGTKILYVAEEENQPKIVAETYTTLMW